MYEALVARLRTMCPEDYGNPMDFAYGVQQAMHEAADAIEELNLVAESNRRNAKAWADTAEKVAEQMPRWIPVTERLPEELFVVLCYCSRNGQFECGEWTLDDHNRVCWTSLNGMIPTHWMYLPEPPKEGTK